MNKDLIVVNIEMFLRVVWLSEWLIDGVVASRGLITDCYVIERRGVRHRGGMNVHTCRLQLQERSCNRVIEKKKLRTTPKKGVVVKRCEEKRTWQLPTINNLEKASKSLDEERRRRLSEEVLQVLRGRRYVGLLNISDSWWEQEIETDCISAGQIYNKYFLQHYERLQEIIQRCLTDD